jgi:hypothetical protein
MAVAQISQELEEHSSLEEKGKRMQREKQCDQESRLHGTPTPLARRISAKHFSRIETKSKVQTLRICEELLSSGYVEEVVVAFDWKFRPRRH